MSEIDRLEIAIEAEASKANRELTKLSNKLEKLSTVLSTLDVNGLSKIGSVFTALSSSMRDFKDIKTSDFTRLAKNIDKIGNVKTGKLKKAGEDLREVAVAVENISGKSVDVKVNTDDLKSSSREINKTGLSIEELSKKFKDVGKLDLSKFGTSNINEINKVILDLEKNFDRLKSREEKMLALNEGQPSGKAWINLQYDINSVLNKLDLYREKLAQLETIKKIKDASFTIDHNNSDYVSNDNEPVRTANVSSESLKYNAEAMRMVFGEAAADIDQWSDAVKRFGANASAVINDLDNMPVSLDLTTYEGQIRRLKAELADMRLDGISAGNEDYDSKYLELEKVVQKQKEYKKYMSELAKISNISADAISGEGNSARLTSNEMKNLAFSKSKASNANKNLGKAAKTTGKGLDAEKSKTNKLTSVLNGMGGTATRIGDQFGRFFSKVSKGFSKIASDAAKSNKKTQNGMNLGKMVGMSILYSTVFRLISTINQGFVTGIQNLSQYSDATNKSMSLLMSGMTQLKNSFATAFAPILNVVAPILDVLIQKIASAVTAVGQFFAALTGQTTFVIAKKVQQNYADSLDKTSKKMKKLAKETNDILPFDEINKLSDNADEPDTGNDTGGLSPTDMFETVPIESKYKKFADKLKSMIAAGEYKKLGKMLGKAINKGLKKFSNFIDWNNIGGRIKKVVTAFTDFFNSLVASIDWSLLGHTIGKTINTIVNTLNLLIEKIDWINLGKSFAKALNGMFDEVDWKNLGRLIGNKFMIAWKTFYGFVSELNFEKIGVSIGEALNGIVENIDLSLIAKSIGIAISGLFSSIIEFANTFDWKEFGVNIYRGINSFFTNTDFEKIGKGISDFAMGILETLNTALDGIDWKLIGVKLGDLLENIDWKGILSGVFEVISKAFEGLLSSFTETNSGKVVLAFGTIFAGAKLGGKVFGLGKKFRDWKEILGLGSAAGKAAAGATSGSTVAGGATAAGAAATTTAGISWLSKLGGTLKSGLLGAGALETLNQTMERTKNIADQSEYMVLINALLDLQNQGKLADDEFNNLSSQLTSAQISKIPFIESMESVQKYLKDTSTSSNDLKTSLTSTIDQMRFKSEDLPYISQLIKGLGDASDGVDFAQLSIKSALEIDSLGGIWENGKQILGEKAISIQEEIKKGLTPDDNGYYTLANGMLVSYGNGLQAGKEGFKSTIDDTFINTLNNKLPEGYKVAYDGSNYMIQGYAAGLEAGRPIIQQKFAGWAAFSKQGFQDEINKMTPDIQKTMGRFAIEGIANPFANSLQIHSPSKLFSEFADFVGKGFVNELEPAFEGAFDFFSKIPARITSALGNLWIIGSNAMTSLANGISSVHIPLPHINVGWNNTAIGASNISLPKFNINWYADGGMPNMGEMFIARERGPEMVGRIGHNNAVANNDQIVSGIKSGVYEAVVNALASSSGGKIEVNVVLEGDSKNIFKVVRKEGMNHINSTGSPVFPI